MRKKTSRSFFIGLTVLSLVSFLIVFPTIRYDFLGFEGEVGGPDIDYSGIEFEAFGQRISILDFDYEKEFKIHQGLDLQGGLQLTYEADMAEVENDQREESLDTIKEIIDRRINALGVAEPNIQTSQSGGNYRVIVELPGINDVDSAKELIGQTAVLEFREFSFGNTTQNITVGEDGETNQDDLNLGPQYLETGLTGEDFRRAEAYIDTQVQSPYYNQPIIAFEFQNEAAGRFSDLTRRLSVEGSQLAIFLDDTIIFQGNTEHITNGEGIISGLGDIENAQNVAIQLNEGALPAPVQLVSERTISPTLGNDALRQSLVAGVIGLAAVAVFMILYYNALGIVATMALLLYVLFSIAIFKYFAVTITLAGIAGFVLSIGMAVDANILIFERFREEIRSGKTLKAAIDVGFNRAWSSIRDSNVASLITCAILIYFGSGMIRGFAITLSIGILLSMFTAIHITRNLLEFMITRKAFQDKKAFGLEVSTESKPTTV